MNTKLKVKCPHCKKSFQYFSSEFRPFCGERCKMIDLGHWLSESYTVPSTEKLADEDIESILQESELRNNNYPEGEYNGES